MTTRRPVGTTDLTTHPLVLGTNTFGWTSDREQSFAVLEAFLAAGGNVVDTADSYSAFAPGNRGGESETIIGEWNAATGRRDELIIGTKVSQHPEFRGLAPATVRAAAEASLQRLRTDRIDVYYAHFDEPARPVEELATAFDGLVRDGLVRHVALSNFSVERERQWLELADAEGLARPVAIQPEYSLVQRRTFERDYAPFAREQGLGVFTYFSLAAGFLTGKYRTPADLEGAARAGRAGEHLTPQGLAVVDVLDAVAHEHGTAPATVALAWQLAHPAVTAPIASARTVEQLAALTAAAGLVLGADELARLDAASAPFA